MSEYKLIGNYGKLGIFAGLSATLVGLFGIKVYEQQQIMLSEAKRELVINKGVEVAALGDTKLSFTTPNKNNAVLGRLVRMSDSINLKAKYPNWNSAKITSTLNYLKK